MNNASLSFLDGGGEMGQLTRDYHWEQNVIGPPAAWPQSLKTTLGILLNAHFPMFLFWGEELICFYNDAYRPSLGNNGKHPGALGQPGAAIWPEIWEVIKPLIDQVMSGGPATWSEDQLIPIYRNGRLEDVYWTFSYSPVRNDEGAVQGVLVTCCETTEKVKQYKALNETAEQLQFAIDAAELGTWDFNPSTNVFQGNKRLKQWFGLKEDEFIPLPLAINAILASDRERVSAAIERALDYSSGGKYDITYTIVHPLTGEERMVRAIGHAFFDEHKTAYRFNGTLQDITREVAATQALQKSENNFRTLVQQAPVAMCVLTGPQFVVEIVNELMAELWGKSIESTVGRPIFEGLPEARDQGLEDLLRHVYETGETFYARERPVILPRAGGLTPIYQNFVYAPYLGPNGEVAGVIAVTYDVTELTLARKKAEELEFSAQMAIEVTELGTYDIDLKRSTIIASPRLNEIYGLPPTTDLAAYVAVMLPEDMPIRTHAYKVALETGEMFYELRIFHGQTGAVRWIRAKGRVIYEHGEPSRLVGALLDITDQKRTIEILEENEKRMKLLADAMPQLVWIADPAGVTEFYNSRIREYHVKPSDTEKSGWEWESMVHPDDAETTLQAWTQAVNTGGTYSIEHRIRMQNGQYRWHLSRGVPDRNAQGEIVNWFGTATDIDAIKKAQEAIIQFSRELENQVAARTQELAAANHHLKQTNLELEQFAYVASHDLQEPLRKVRTFASMLDQSNPAAKTLIEKIDRSTARMTRLIKDVLNFSRLAGSGEMFEKTDLAVVLANILGDFELLITEEKAEIEADVLPVIDAVPLQINQLFANLVGNALKFRRPDKAPVVTITASVAGEEELLRHPELHPGKKYCLLIFKDNGIGFKQEHSTQIFNIFQRLHSKDEYSGTGIGLALCKKIVLNHQGSIEAYGSQGEGATFKLILPYEQ